MKTHFRSVNGNIIAKPQNINSTCNSIYTFKVFHVILWSIYLLLFSFFLCRDFLSVINLQQSYKLHLPMVSKTETFPENSL